jgi:hypothetical protein
MGELSENRFKKEERTQDLFFKMLAVIPPNETMEVVAKALCTFFAHIMNMEDYDKKAEEDFLKSINQEIQAYRKAYKSFRKL